MVKKTALILRKKMKPLLLFGFFLTIGFISFTLSETTEVICANTYYEGTRTCEIRDAPNCPEGTTEFGNYCMPQENPICEDLTGNSRLAIRNGVPVCESPPLAGKGTCNASAFELAGSSYNQQFNNFSVETQEILANTITNRIGRRDGFRDASRLIGGTMNIRGNSYNITPQWIIEYLQVPGSLDEFYSSSLYVPTGEGLGSVLSLGCIEESSIQYIKPPAVGITLINRGDFIPVGAGGDAENNLIRTSALTQARLITQDGFPLYITNRFDSAFCNIDELSLSIQSNLIENFTSDEKFYCVDLPTGDEEQACGIDLVEGLNDVCFSGANDNYRNVISSRGNLFYISQQSDPFDIDALEDENTNIFGPDDVISSDDFFDVERAGTKCKYNAKDLLSGRSNKGCSEYTRVDFSTNQLVATDQELYRQCVRCIYGSTNFNPDNYRSVPYDTSSLTIPRLNSSGDGPPITPNTEPFATPQSGYIFNELGCINTSDPAATINTFVRIALGLMGGIVVFRIIQGALTMQAGDPESFEEGRDIITSALVGLLVLIFSASIMNFLGINILGFEEGPQSDTEPTRPGFEEFGP